MNLAGRACAVLILSSGLCFSAQGQIIVNVRPARPTVIVNQPPRPGPDYIWVEEDWRGRGTNYEWYGGRWIARPSQSATWVPGHWDRRDRGEIWVPGYWNRHDRGLHKGHYKMKGKKNKNR